MESRTVPWLSAKKHARTRLRCRAEHARPTRSRHKFPRDLENQESWKTMFFHGLWPFEHPGTPTGTVQRKFPRDLENQENLENHVFHSFGPFDYPGTITGTVQRKFPRDLENQENLENQVFP